jgi:cell division protein YceG involved in septum cleavage
MVQSWVFTDDSGRTSSTSSARPQTGWRAARISFFLVAFVLLFTGFTFMRTFAAQQHVEPVSATEHVISVDTGDTLWSLAASVKRDSMDTREAVDQLMSRNGLTSSSLESGQALIIPESILP